MEKDDAKAMIWGNLLHLSFNMWEDWQAPNRGWRGYDPVLRFDEQLWLDLVERMADKGLNMVVLDLGDGIHYASHPEIAVKNAWTAEKLREELARLRSYGIEPIPKLNFATTHDAWLGKYSRSVSTPVYYKVCEDLINEVIELFDKPRFFHLGMDEETAAHQRDYQYVVIRQFDLFWHDFDFLRRTVEQADVRAWVWSDYIWNHRDEFVEKMPKSVLQSNWYYGCDFKRDIPDAPPYVETYDVLEAHGYDQIPTGSNHSHRDNFDMTVKYCCEHINSSRLLGFLQTPWRPTVEEFRAHHLEAIDVVAEKIRELAL